MSSYTLADMTRMTGASRRSIQFWSDAGVILAEQDTDRAGRGVHRRFSRQEAVIACAVHAFARQHMSIGQLRTISDEFRNYLSEGALRGAVWHLVERAVNNEEKIHLTFVTSDQGSAVRIVGTLPPDTDSGLRRNEQNLAREFEHLDQPGGFLAAILLNTYVSGLR